MSSEDKRQAHSNFNFTIAEGINLHICSDFDSGNLQSAAVLDICFESQNLPTVSLVLVPALEPFNPNYSTKPSTKTFFHFNAKCNSNIVIHAIIKRMNILSYVQGSFEEYYRLCVGKKQNPYQEPQYEKIKPDYMRLNKNQQQYSLEYKYLLPAQQRLYFAYHYPYSIEKLSNYLHNLKSDIDDTNLSAAFVGNNKFIYYRNQLLIQSVESRPINILTITEIQVKNAGPDSNKSQYNSGKIARKMSVDNLANCDNQIKLNLARQPRISRSLFPFYDIQPRPYKFNKPYILITCRVHPGQTSASYALQGFINRLIDANNSEAEFIRKSFTIIIVPMVNPDGVFHGTYRMDTLGHNLNRFYNNCVAHKQPSIFAIQSIMNQCSDQIVCFFDIHSHPQLKGSFFYGNAYQSIYDQIQSQTFAKLLSVNSECFGYELCSFSERNMNSKDVNEIMTKDGSSRVCAFRKITNNIHCYTLQMGYHGAPVKKQPAISFQLQKFKDDYRRSIKLFYCIDYLHQGAAVLTTIAQIYIQTASSFQQNNYIINNAAKNQVVLPLAQLRQDIGKQINQKEQRFKMMDGGINKKLKIANSTILNNYYTKIFKKYSSIETNTSIYNQGLTANKQNGKDQGLVKQYRSQTLRNHSVDKQKQIYPYEHSVSLNKQSGTIQKYNFFLERNVGRNKISVARQLTQVLKKKINIAPSQFQMIPPENKIKSHGKTKNNLNSQDKIMNLNFDPLPKIPRKPLKIFSDRQKSLRRKATSSVSKNQDNGYIQLPDRNFHKMTIDNQLSEIIGCEAMMNYENQIQFRDEQLNIYKANQQKNDDIYEEDMEFDQRFDGMNMLHQGLMYKRTSDKTQRIKQKNMHLFSNQDNQNQVNYKITKNYQTQRVAGNSAKRQKMISSIGRANKDPQRKLSTQKLKDAFLPKLEMKSDRIRNKFELELKMRQKYERQYKIVSHWNRDKKSDDVPMKN